MHKLYIAADVLKSIDIILWYMYWHTSKLEDKSEWGTYEWCTIIIILSSWHVANKQVTLFLDIDISTVIECIDIAIIVTVYLIFIVAAL